MVPAGGPSINLAESAPPGQSGRSRPARNRGRRIFEEPLRVESFFESLPIWANATIFAAGVFAVVKGADWFTDGAVGVRVGVMVNV